MKDHVVALLLTKRIGSVQIAGGNGTPYRIESRNIWRGTATLTKKRGGERITVRASTVASLDDPVSE